MSHRAWTGLQRKQRKECNKRTKTRLSVHRHDRASVVLRNLFYGVNGPTATHATMATILPCLRD
jgi:hypothetical protein